MITERAIPLTQTKDIENTSLEDVQNSPSELLIPIDRVGIKDFRMPLVVNDLTHSFQHTIAHVDMGVDLPASFKGTHMSRFIEALEAFHQSNNEKLDYNSLKDLLLNVCNKLEAQKVDICFRFPYFISKKAPVSKANAQVVYDCIFTGIMDKNKKNPEFLLEIVVPVTTVCPCSKAISKAGAHGQRAHINMKIYLNHFTWLEEFIHIAESSASAPIYSILKREDEKAVTEQAYENAYFVEDVVRRLASKLQKHKHVEWFKVEVESFESIHGHNAFACIEMGQKPLKD